MTARRSPAAPTCANPVCSAPVDLEAPDAIELAQAQAGRKVRWVLCDTRCLRIWIALCDVKFRAESEVTR